MVVKNVYFKLLCHSKEVSKLFYFARVSYMQVTIIIASMDSRPIWKKDFVSFSSIANCARPSDSCNFDCLVIEKLTCVFQIALETILLPIQITSNLRQK
jgi:hypothetical protein